MIKNPTLSLFIIAILLISNSGDAQVYPDQQYVIGIDSIIQNIESINGIKLSDDGKYLMLQDGVLEGALIIKPQVSSYPFNQGLPSWNGTAPQNSSAFKVQMRFPYGTGWSTWLTVGYWRSNIWSVYGPTTYGGGYIDYDYAQINSYINSWQFRITMTRTSDSQPSPTLNKLGFFVSDSRTTSNLNLSQILADNPGSIFVPTAFIHQYSVDPVIGGDICSPTTVSMILKSYNINVDPYQFALSTYDPYYEMFGIWPRVVQNASEYGLDGVVNRYRTWSEAREVLAKGGRIAMSIGQPLYSGHLVMLAGFTNDGRPIVHDPAKSYGYSLIYDKTDISQSWFNKGGIAYTFYPAGTVSSADENKHEILAVDDFILYQNYPNPFNPSTSIQYSIASRQFVQLKVYDVLGNEVATLVDEYREAGRYEVEFQSTVNSRQSTIGSRQLTSGVYLYQLLVSSFGGKDGKAGDFIQTKKMILLR